jgi:hypothetical protein
LVRTCCYGADGLSGVIETSDSLNPGDVILDDNGNCWEVGDTTADAVTVTYSTLYDGNCATCIKNQGCTWEVRCCTGGPDNKIVNDFGIGLVIGDVVLCGDNICRVVIQPTVKPVNETINVVYPDCGECFSSGGQECV